MGNEAFCHIWYRRHEALAIACSELYHARPFSRYSRVMSAATPHPMPTSPLTKHAVHAELLLGIEQQISMIIVGKSAAVRLALACLLARGHLLIEDIPGVGKTTLAQALATTLGLPFRRIQFTSDLLPADILGVSIFDSSQHVFRFQPGPIFTSVVLADEVNRAPPKTQS